MSRFVALDNGEYLDLSGLGRNSGSRELPTRLTGVKRRYGAVELR